MIKRIYSKFDKFVPRGVQVIMLLSVVAAGLHIGFTYNTSFADFFNTYVSTGFRAVLAYATMWIPFSFAEALIIFLPILAVFAIVKISRYTGGSWRKLTRALTSVISVLLVIYILFVTLMAAGYRAVTLDEKLGLEADGANAEELYSTTLAVVDALNEAADNIVFTSAGSSLMPYDLNTLNDKLMDAYGALSADYSFIPDIRTRFKPIALSEPMTYTHIAGVYSFFTGEANVNVNYPDYVNAYTAAHELAHQRGIARENEANFIAYLVCLSSDDEYLRYSGYLNMFEYLASALRRASREYYSDVYAKLDSRVYGELRAYSKFFEKYTDNIASNVSGAVNNSYLQSQGTPGTVSYGLVVDLAVAYHEKNEN